MARAIRSRHLFCYLVRLEPYAVILHGETKFVILDFESERDMTRVSVFAGIRQGLLRDTVNGCFHALL